MMLAPSRRVLHSVAGAINHLTGKLFNYMTGTQIVHVPYKGGGPAAIALLSGEVEMIFGEHIRAEIAKWAPVIKAAGLKVD